MKDDLPDFVEQLPSELDINSTSIYYSPDYLSLCDGKVVCFSIIDQSSGQRWATICFQLNQNRAISLGSAPFGGIQSQVPLAQNTLNQFWDYVILRLQSYNIDQITIKDAPSFYDCTESKSPNIKTSVATDEIYHHIPIDQHALSTRLKDMQVRRLKKCKQAGFTFKKESLSALPEIYQFIEMCRSEKNYMAPMPKEKLEASMIRLPDAYHIFCCYDGDRLIAATICVSVTEDVLYHFLPASLATYNQYSPMVFLINEIYDFGQRNDYKHLDLGSSMLDGKPNKKLISFKASMAGMEERRSIYTIEL